MDDCANAFVISIYSISGEALLLPLRLARHLRCIVRSGSTVKFLVCLRNRAFARLCRSGQTTAYRGGMDVSAVSVSGVCNSGFRKNNPKIGVQKRELGQQRTTARACSPELPNSVLY